MPNSLTTSNVAAGSSHPRPLFTGMGTRRTTSPCRRRPSPTRSPGASTSTADEENELGLLEREPPNADDESAGEDGKGTFLSGCGERVEADIGTGTGTGLLCSGEGEDMVGTAVAKTGVGGSEGEAEESDGDGGAGRAVEMARGAWA